MERNTENCDRCLPKIISPAMGYIPLPEMTNIGDTRGDERRILLCNHHYFEAKKNCYYVVPFNRDNDPVDSFLTRVNQKHKELRGNLRLKFRANFRVDSNGNGEQEAVESTLPIKRRATKTHLLEDGRTLCGTSFEDAALTTKIDGTTCKNCILLFTKRASEALHV